MQHRYNRPTFAEVCNETGVNLQHSTVKYGIVFSADSLCPNGDTQPRDLFGFQIFVAQWPVIYESYQNIIVSLTQPVIKLS